MCWTTQKAPTTSGVGIAMGVTNALSAQLIRNLSTVNDARSMGIRTKRAGEAGELQGAPLDQATLHAPRHLPQFPAPLRKKRKRRRRRKNKDDLAETRSPKTFRGRSAHRAIPHQRVAVDPTARHVASQAELRKQREKFATQ